MTKPRPIRALGAALLALVVAVAGLRASPLVEHEHAAGERAHVHAADDVAVAELLAWLDAETHEHGEHAEHVHGGAAHGGQAHPHAHPHRGAARAVAPAAARERAQRSSERSWRDGRHDDVALASAPGSALRHAHWRSSKHVAARVGLPAAGGAAIAVPAPPVPAPRPTHVDLRELRARAPPSRAV